MRSAEEMDILSDFGAAEYSRKYWISAERFGYILGENRGWGEEQPAIIGASINARVVPFH
jgi:hypothetical protein